MPSAVLAAVAAVAALAFARSAWAGERLADSAEIRVLDLQGTVEVLPAGARNWYLTQTNQVLHAGDRLRTGDKSRVTLRWSDQSVVPFGPLSELEILPPDKAGSLSGLSLVRGILSFFHRDQPGRIRVLTRGATASVEGTEFVLEVREAGGQERVTLSVIDGRVDFRNAQGGLLLTNAQQAVAEPGQAPLRTAGFIANNVLQWVFYYPGVLDLEDLSLSPAKTEVLQASLVAYRAGDLLAALAKYPTGRIAVSTDERIYHAALLLAVGAVAECEAELAALPADAESARLADALRTLIAAVKRQPKPGTRQVELGTELLAASYYEQSLAMGDDSLRSALELARQATEVSPQFGFAWARVAELEFSFGRTAAAERALDTALEISPRNAQALALKGFMLAVRNQTREAIAWFDRAIAVDGALGNAWLGRGLCRIRRGDAGGGREDLLVAAALEPQRAVLRSYLGKAYANVGDTALAEKELRLARTLDANEPTPWLYSALLKQQQNRVNEAVRDLEKSVDLNDNRSLFRSRMLLDQDRAVRGANLASVYRDAGMDDVSVRAATRAVNYDYANYSAHLFLANSYNQLRDPQQINLRYETPWLSEYLVANLLAPVGAGTLSQSVSQQEYSKLFERDRFGVASTTEYLDRGDWLQGASAFGNTGNFGFAVDTFYRNQNGQRSNNDQEQLTVSVQLKYDLTPKDSVFFQMIHYDAEAGDLAQYYNPASARLNLRTEEKQEPLLLAGYRHEWSPGIQTLMVAGRFDDDYTVTDTSQPVLLLAKNGAGQVIAVPTPRLPTAPLNYRSQLEMYSAELQQIFQKGEHTLVFGARYQTADFNTDTTLGASTPTQLASLTATTALAFATSPLSQSARTDFERITGYGYWFWRVIDPLQLSAGLSYDHLSYPQNYRYPPTSGAEDSQDQLSPKAGFTWTPARDTVVRFAYTRSLGGVSFDQSVRLEPTQVAGFNQAFRSLMPESVVGSVAGAEFETFGLAFEQKFKTGTYLGLEAQLLNSEADRTIGAVDLFFPPTYVASSTRQNLDYQEQNLIVTLNQLLGDGWSLGARYQLLLAELETVYPDIPATVTSANRTEDEALLHQLSLFALYNHRCGFFARAEGNWYSQDNRADSSALADDQFWQVNLFAGYRFWQRRAQVQVGVLNLTDQDYRLNPLNLYRELPRERAFFASVQFNF
ncbi:MAG: FecR domain-containing protein [Verrucomicrobia bacterium]|nr:FecR domain-containing protein [Verrucomicrobiota bacterium]